MAAHAELQAMKRERGGGYQERQTCNHATELQVRNETGPYIWHQLNNDRVNNVGSMHAVVATAKVSAVPVSIWMRMHVCEGGKGGLPENRRPSMVQPVMPNLVMFLKF